MSNGNGEPAGGTDNGNDAIGGAGSATGPGGSGGYQPAPGEIIIDPVEQSAGSGSGNDSTGSRKPRSDRGRKRGPRAAASSAGTQNLDLSGVESVLLSIHNMLAAMTSIPEFLLDQDEAKKLAGGIEKVARHYDIPATQKTIDWVNLGMVAVGVYGTRIAAYRIRLMAVAQKRGAIHPISETMKSETPLQ